MANNAEPTPFQKFTRLLETTPLGSFKTAKNTKIIDWKLGLMHHALTAVAIAYGVWVIQSAYQSAEAIGDAGVSFYFGGQSSMTAAANKSADEMPAFCNNHDYDYNYCWGPNCDVPCPDGGWRRDQSCDDVDNWWDDTNIDCRAFPYGKVGQKFNDQGFVQTFNKMTSYKEALCADTDWDTLCPAVPSGQRQWTYKTMTEYGELCTCKTTQDYFVLGAEKLELTFEHGFTTSAILNHKGLNWKGRSSLLKSDFGAGTKAIETTLFKDCDPGAMWHEPNTDNAWFGPCKKVASFKPGDEVYQPVDVWLDMADVILDEQVPGGSVTPATRHRGRHFCHGGVPSASISRSSSSTPGSPTTLRISSARCASRRSLTRGPSVFQTDVRHAALGGAGRVVERGLHRHLLARRQIHLRHARPHLPVRLSDGPRRLHSGVTSRAGGGALDGLSVSQPIRP